MSRKDIKCEEFECDVCGTTEVIGGELSGPSNWAVVLVPIASGKQQKLDFCPACSLSPIASLQKAKQRLGIQ